jgi:very-short-patch-repair endonuclease
VRCVHNPDRKVSSGNTGKIAWNRGKSKDTDPIMQQISEKLTGRPGRSFSDEAREKISTGMKKAHKEQRAWNIGMNRWKKQPSYAEAFFQTCIDNEFENKNVKREVYFKRYVIDFLWEDIKTVIEIDGKQHEEPKQKERDQRKDLLLKEHGYRVLRIKWSDFCKDTKSWITIANNFTRP